MSSPFWGLERRLSLCRPVLGEPSSGQYNPVCSEGQEKEAQSKACGNAQLARHRQPSSRKCAPAGMLLARKGVRRGGCPIKRRPPSVERLLRAVRKELPLEKDAKQS